MKKNLLRIVCILMALFMLPVHAFAAEQAAQEEALTGAAAINYVQKNADFVGSEYRTVTTSQNNRMEFRVDTYTKTEPVGLTRSGAAEYATTTYTILNTRASGSVSDSDTDYKGYALMTLTVYFTNLYENLVSGRIMTRVTGSCTIITSGAELKSHYYYLHEVGTGFYTGLPVNKRLNYTLSRTPLSWSATVNNSLYPGIETASGSQHAIYYCTFSNTETGETWSDNVQVPVT